MSNAKRYRFDCNPGDAHPSFCVEGTAIEDHPIGLAIIDGADLVAVIPKDWSVIRGAEIASSALPANSGCRVRATAALDVIDDWLQQGNELMEPLGTVRSLLVAAVGSR